MLIRKLAVGPDYLKSMNYSVGQKVMGDCKINQINFNSETGQIEIWIINKDLEIVLWKSFTSTMPVSVEYNIDHFLEEKP